MIRPGYFAEDAERIARGRRDIGHGDTAPALKPAEEATVLALLEIAAAVDRLRDEMAVRP